jgi:hypothetical protein
MSLMLPFTYLAYHHIVTGSLQYFKIYICFCAPINENATHVHLATSLAGRTFGTLVTSNSAPVTAWRPLAQG